MKTQNHYLIIKVRLLDPNLPNVCVWAGSTKRNVTNNESLKSIAPGWPWRGQEGGHSVLMSQLHRLENSLESDKVMSTDFPFQPSGAQTGSSCKCQAT